MRTLTFLFADLREYTAFVERHGDLAASRLIAEYRRLVRTEVDRTGGAEVKTEGDSFYVVFDAASDAVRCGMAVLRAAEAYSRRRPERPMRVGMGIHSGEAQPTDDGQYVGLAVIVAARLAQQADAGELLVSDVVRSLLPRHAVPEMRERSGLVLKGIADAPRALAVSWALPEASASADLVGREAEISDLTGMLDEPSARLITLTGPGGVGKTRLAQAAADRAADRFADGSLFIDLSPVRSASEVPAAIAEAARVLEVAGRSRARALLDALRERDQLLVLDNFEQLIDAAPFVSQLLAGTERLRILVTSRQPLRVRSERVVVLAPLSTKPAASLFIERARAAGGQVDADRDRDEIAQICRRLDGLPLAIELAAARTRHLTPRALLARMRNTLPLLERGPRDAPERQRTLTAAIAWSHDLLDDGERVVFRRCAAFAGGFTASAAAAVGSLHDPARALEVLTTLADQSLLVVEADGVDGDPRFRALETIREYAAARLEESGEAAAVRERHARYFGDLAQQALPRLEQADQADALSLLDREQANIRAALAWAVASGDVEWGLRLASDLWIYWFIRGSLSEGRDRIAELLAAAGDAVDPAVRAAALNAEGTLARYQRDNSAAEALISEALAIRRGLGDPKAIADSLNNLAYVTLSRGDQWRARSLYEEAIGTYRARGDQQGIADAVSHLALIALHERDLPHAKRLADEALGIWRRLGDLQGVAWQLEGIGKIQLEAGETPAAIATFEEGLAASTSLGHGWAIALHIDGLACAAAAQDRPTRALRLAGAAAAILKRVGTPLDPMHERLRHRWLERARLALRPARAEEAYAAGSLLGQDEAVAEALAKEPVETPARRDEWSGLSEREREVAALIAQGLTNKQIAQRLFIASGTADRHVANILGKLDVRNRAQVAVWVAERGLLQSA